MSEVEAPPIEEVDLLPDDELPAERISPPGALFGVLFRPAATFRKMREAAHSHWWVVALIAVIAWGLLWAGSASEEAELFRAQMSGVPQGVPEEAIEARQQAQAGGGPEVVFGISRLVGGIVLLPISYLIHASLLYLMGLAMGGRASFRQVFRMGVWTLLPSAFRNLVAAIAVLAKGELPAPGMSYVLTGAEASSQPVLAAVLQTFDLYRLWTVLLVGIGVAATYRLSRGKSLVAALIYWLIVVLLAVGLGALQQLGAGFGGG